MYLHIPQIQILIGASIGAQQALQWLVSYPNSMKHAIVMAGESKASTWLQAINFIQQNIIEADATWGERSDTAGMQSMQIARQLGVVSFRSSKIFSLSQNRVSLLENIADEKSDNTKFDNVFSYLAYQGSKFATRFNAFSYIALLDMMNTHDISTGYPNMETALKRVCAGVLSIGIDSDLIFTHDTIKETSSKFFYGYYREISSVYGHDAFLIETKQLEDIISDYFMHIGV